MQSTGKWRNEPIFLCWGFAFYFQILENVFLNSFRCRQDVGELPFSTYVHRACTFSIARYDALAYGTAYLIKPANDNQHACGLFGASGHRSLER